MFINFERAVVEMYFVLPISFLLKYIPVVQRELLFIKKLVQITWFVKIILKPSLFGKITVKKWFF